MNETLEQVIERTKVETVKRAGGWRFSGEDLDWLCRQLAAWCYRDAARFFCPDCACGHPVTRDRLGNFIHEFRGVMELDDGLEHAMCDFSICKAEALERRAEEAERHG